MRVAGVFCGVVLGFCKCEEVIFGVLYIFFDLQARATSEIAVADLSESENL